MKTSSNENEAKSEIILENRASAKSSMYRFCGSIKADTEANADSPSPAYHVAIEGCWDKASTKISITRSKIDGVFHTLLLEKIVGLHEYKGKRVPVLDALKEANDFFSGKYQVIINHGVFDNPIVRAA
jgi:hypothetical protein